MQQQQAQVDAVSKEMDKTRDTMTKANVAIKTAGTPSTTFLSALMNRD